MQPCDVDVQHIFKHSLKRSYHEDIVRSISQQIDNSTENILFDKRKAVLRDLSVKWIWDDYNAVNRPKIVRKAFEMCHVCKFDLSYASLTSFAAREKLHQLKHTDPEFWAELTESHEHALAAGQAALPEDDTAMKTLDQCINDDSSLLCGALVAELMGSGVKTVHGIVSTDDGSLAACGEVKAMEFKGGEEAALAVEEELGRGRRRQKANTLQQRPLFATCDAGSLVLSLSPSHSSMQINMLLIKDLAAACPNADPLGYHIMETYLPIQLGINALDGACHDEAADHFTATVNSTAFSSKFIHQMFEDLIMLFGWDLESLLFMTHQKQCQDFLAVGKPDEALEAHKYMMDDIDEPAT
ncbi:hypothetical protein C8R48DRAFT_776634 [Suillus tomentosus]|nr:hypothetical protein C8R48DRAFT_776634 [Suillus tomentosus]